MNLTLESYIAWVESGTLNPAEVVSAYLKKAKEENKKYNAYISFADQYVTENIDALSKLSLHGAPIAVKDIILTKGVETTCASKILAWFIPPYSASCFIDLEKHGGCMIGKANMDEFAMGSGNENSAYWAVTNPYGDKRIPGWTSGGSAVAVAADLCIAALGTDTWGSVRQPAFMCWIVGLKPTYGRVSRYGVQSMASSFDQVWVLTKTVKDAAILLDAIASDDKNDATNMAKDDHNTWFEAIQSSSLKGKKIWYFTQFFDEGIDPRIAQHTKDVLHWAELQGATIVPIDFPLLKYVIAAYYILTPAEVSTNMARFDGIRYWLQDDTGAFDTIKSYYASVRDRGFWTEVKRRILLGSYVLSAWFYDAYYRKAQQVRKKMQQRMFEIYKDVDVILGPTSPELARRIWERVNDPLKNYLADIYTVTANIGWFPAVNIPTGSITENGEVFKLWVQLMANHWREDLLFGIGNTIHTWFIW